MIPKLGLIEGRHPLPVDEYILEADVTDSVGFHQGLYDAAYKAAFQTASKYPGQVDLYITGLTVAALGAATALRDNGVLRAVMNFDRESGQYVEVVI